MLGQPVDEPIGRPVGRPIGEPAGLGQVLFCISDVPDSGVVGVRLLGRQPDQWRPQWYHLLVLNVCCEVGMTYNDGRSLHNIAGGLGDAISPQRVQGRALVGVQGAKPLEAPKNLHLTVS